MRDSQAGPMVCPTCGDMLVFDVLDDEKDAHRKQRTPG
jgi:hypothetical protein